MEQQIDFHFFDHADRGCVLSESRGRSVQVSGKRDQRNGGKDRQRSNRDHDNEDNSVKAHGATSELRFQFKSSPSTSVNILVRIKGVGGPPAVKRPRSGVPN